MELENTEINKFILLSFLHGLGYNQSSLSFIITCYLKKILN